MLCLQAGVSKLNEAKTLVDELKRRAAEQSELLRTKQQEADSALQEITTSMQVCMSVLLVHCPLVTVYWDGWMGGCGYTCVAQDSSPAGFHVFSNLYLFYVYLSNFSPLFSSLAFFFICIALYKKLSAFPMAISSLL